MEVCINSGRYQNGGVIVPRFTAYKQWTQQYCWNQLFSQENCTDTIWAGPDLHLRAVFRILQKEKKLWKETFAHIHLSRKTKTQLYQHLYTHLTLSIWAVPTYLNGLWIRAIIITKHDSLLSIVLFFQGHLCGCLYKNTVKNQEHQ